MLITPKYTLRQLAKNPGFATVTLLTLAFCIGANTAIFSLVYGLILKPLPFHNPSRIVEIYNSFLKSGLKYEASSVVQYLDYKRNAGSYESVGLWASQQEIFGAASGAERVTDAVATADIFSVLGVKPVIGRFFSYSNSVPGDGNVVVLTQSFWQSHFREDPDVLNKTVIINGETFNVIGIAPRSIETLDARVRFVRPLMWPHDHLNPLTRYITNFHLFGRLKHDVTIGQAHAEVDMLERRFGQTDLPPYLRIALDHAGYKVGVEGIQILRAGRLKASVYLLQAGVIFVLLIGCVNIANLFLARANARQADLSLRLALGATRITIAGQLLSESLLLTGIGAILGLGLVWSALGAINRFTAHLLPSEMASAIDWQVLGFTIVVSILVAGFVSLAPVICVLRSNLSEVIQRNTRSASVSSRVRTLSNAFIVGQIALALVLLSGAGLLIHSFANAMSVNVGFEPRRIITGRVAMPSADRNSDAAARGIRERIITGLREIPGVESVALATAVPFQGGWPVRGMPANNLWLADDKESSGSPRSIAFHAAVSPGYFETLRVPLVAGRFIEPGDVAVNRGVFVVDQVFAKRFFGDGSAIGKRFKFGAKPKSDSEWSTIIGVVRDVPLNGLEDRTGIPFVYETFLHSMPDEIDFLLRTPRPVLETISLTREKLRMIDPTLILFEARPIQSIINASFDNRRAVMALIIAFAVLALFLAAVGIYGVLAYDVTQRRREIGVRGALGATRRQIVGMVIKQGLWKAGIGVVGGLIGALLLSRYMTTLLFDLRPNDPVVYLGVSILVLGVAAVASYLPARRAAKIDPIETLRNE